jgi:hypothetical protein
MKNHSLSAKGLSLSQAQSVSNLCNQRAKDIQASISVINNATKVITIDGKEYTKTVGNAIPYEIVDLLKEKARLHAAQAFLMENIRAKDEMLKEVRSRRFNSNIEGPESPRYTEPEYIDPVDEQWGWEQLSTNEYCEFLEAEAFASHIGQFIHGGGKLDKLRKELPTMELLEWAEIEDGKKTPVVVSAHHTSEYLADLHEDLSGLHREYEQKVNYYKAKVKNLVTLENARIARVNADNQSAANEVNDKLITEYKTARQAWLAQVSKATNEFEEARQKETAQIAALRIEVSPIFKEVIDGFLSKLGKE